MAEGDLYASPPFGNGPPSVFNTLTVPRAMLYPHALSPAKDTFTPLEIDVLPNHILNRRRLKPRGLHHDFIELLYQPLDPDEKLVPAVAELWEDERRRRQAKGLSLSEAAMMPGSGGMGGRSKEELGYKVDGKDLENKGGDWKISDELWGMIEARMGEQRRRRGKLTFERFSGDISAGRDGEKRKYDRVSQFYTVQIVLSDLAVGDDDLRSGVSALAPTTSSPVHAENPPFSPVIEGDFCCRSVISACAVYVAFERSHPILVAGTT